MTFTTAQLNEKAMILYPHTHKNNRGIFRKGKSFIRCGYPEPKGNEKDSDLKGSDRCGYKTIIIKPEDVGKKIAVFVGIELKGPGDKIKEGQVKFHNLILEAGAISEIHLCTGEIIKTKTTKEEVNKRNG